MAGQPSNERGASEVAAGRARRQVALSFVAFALLFAQPAVVFALSVGTPDLGSVASIGLGSAMLAVATARAFVRQGRSTERLGDFLVTLALVQIVLLAVERLVATGLAVEPPPLALPAIVLLAFPLAWALVYATGSPVSVGFGR
jgi:vacuolar-type H+-ATPase subunit I/STV1